MNSRRLIASPEARDTGIVAAQTSSGKGVANVRFGSKADVCSAKRHVRFTLDGVIGKSAYGYTVGLVSSKAGTALAY